MRRRLRQDVHGQIARFDELFGARGERLTDAAVGGRGHGAGARFALAPFDERGGNVVGGERTESQLRTARSHGWQQHVRPRGDENENR